MDVYSLCDDEREANLNARGYSVGDDKRILDALGRGLLKEFPNPERSGCPGSDVLKRIASKTMPLTEAEKWLSHLGSCSPCYKDFSELRKGREVQRKRTLLAIAASILVAVGIASWVLIRRHNESLVAQTAVVDLRNSSVSRSPEPNPEEKSLELRRGFSQLNIYLPLGEPWRRLRSPYCDCLRGFTIDRGWHSMVERWSYLPAGERNTIPRATRSMHNANSETTFRVELLPTRLAVSDS